MDGVHRRRIGLPGRARRLARSLGVRLAVHLAHVVDVTALFSLADRRRLVVVLFRRGRLRARLRRERPCPNG
jgi:hypothetical protein